MVRVLVIGDSDVATALVRHALAGVPGVEVVDRAAGERAPVVDTIVIDQTLGPRRAAESLRALAAKYSGASLLVIELHRGDEYRWVHFQPRGMAFRVYNAGTGTLSGVLATSLNPSRTGRGAPAHATVPAMP